jgi:prepilin-type N-terminal cleavage/methylation domain-containing protein
MNTQYKEKGFTIIEVVLVLAIAGLIFLMVFLALPALQSSQRDSARKNDVSIIAAAVSTYTGNNKGAAPTSDQLVTYIANVSDNTTKAAVTANPTGTNPSGIYVRSGAGTLSPNDSSVIVSFASKCGATGAQTGFSVLTGTKRQFTVVTKVEAADGTWICQDS